MHCSEKKLIVHKTSLTEILSFLLLNNTALPTYVDLAFVEYREV